MYQSADGKFIIRVKIFEARQFWGSQLTVPLSPRELGVPSGLCPMDFNSFVNFLNHSVGVKC